MSKRARSAAPASAPKSPPSAPASPVSPLSPRRKLLVGLILGYVAWLVVLAAMYFTTIQ